MFGGILLLNFFHNLAYPEIMDYTQVRAMVFATTTVTNNLRSNKENIEISAVFEIVRNYMTSKFRGEM